jgi:hypothetical protein
MNQIQVIKMVRASPINEDGEEIYPKTWNQESISMPVPKSLLSFHSRNGAEWMRTQHIHFV